MDMGSERETFSSLSAQAPPAALTRGVPSRTSRLSGVGQPLGFLGNSGIKLAHLRGFKNSETGGGVTCSGTHSESEAVPECSLSGPPPLVHQVSTRGAGRVDRQGCCAKPSRLPALRLWAGHFTSPRLPL